LVLLRNEKNLDFLLIIIWELTSLAFLLLLSFSLPSDFLFSSRFRLRSIDISRDLDLDPLNLGKSHSRTGFVSFCGSVLLVERSSRLRLSLFGDRLSLSSRFSSLLSLRSRSFTSLSLFRLSFISRSLSSPPPAPVPVPPPPRPFSSLLDLFSIDFSWVNFGACKASLYSGLKAEFCDNFVDLLSRFNLVRSFFNFKIKRILIKELSLLCHFYSLLTSSSVAKSTSNVFGFDWGHCVLCNVSLAALADSIFWYCVIVNKRERKEQFNIFLLVWITVGFFSVK
jgi:hypothetical protein